MGQALPAGLLPVGAARSGGAWSPLGAGAAFRSRFSEQQ